MTESGFDVSFPESIVTNRLDLRRYDKVDAGDVAELIGSNRRHLLRNFPELSKSLTTPDEVDRFIAKCGVQWNDKEIYCYGIWTRVPGQLVGQLKVKNIRWEVPSAELSYFVGQEFLRHGYASEAITAILSVAFRKLGFNRVYVRIILSNVASTQLALKIGMRHEGLHRSEFRDGFGELHDMNYYSMTRTDYLSFA